MESLIEKYNKLWAEWRVELALTTDKVKYQFYNEFDEQHYGDICEATIVTNVTVSPVRDYFAMWELPDGRKHYFSLWSHEIKEVLLDNKQFVEDMTTVFNSFNNEVSHD